MQKKIDDAIRLAATIWPDGLPEADFMFRVDDETLEAAERVMASAQRVAAESLLAVKGEDPSAPDHREQLIAVWNAVRKAAGLDPTPREHRFVVTVSDCSAEQAHEVMRDQIDHWATYSFTYNIGWKAENDGTH